MIQLVMNGGQISVLAADKVRIDSNVNSDAEERRSSVISAIRQMLEESNFRGKDVVSCLPNDKLKVTSLRLAEADSEKIEQALRKETAERFGLDPDRDAINYVLAGNVRQGEEIKNELILFAAENETIKNHIEMLEEAKLRPVAIDPIPCALFRSFQRGLRRQEDRARTVVFTDVGSWFTTVVFNRGGEIGFVKQIPIGGEKFNQEIARRLGINVNEAEMLRAMLRKQSPHPPRNQGQQQLDAKTQQVVIDAVRTVAEELAREISLCLRYYTVTFRGKRVERAVFAGGEAYENILLNVLSRQLTVEIEVAQPLKGFDLSSERLNINFDSDRRGLLCEWAVAVGLGLKGWDGTGAGQESHSALSSKMRT
jgi:type IV pilus assembly protein PilM